MPRGSASRKTPSATSVTSDAVHARLGDPDRRRHPGQSPTWDTARSSSGVGVP